MKKALYILILIVVATNIFGQVKPVPQSELETISFVSEVKGPLSTFINPAGLALFPNDDGVFANYSFIDTTANDERNFMFSMGNLAVGALEYRLEPDDLDWYLRTYRVSISVGGKVISIGTTNKLYHLQWPHHSTREFSIDAGIYFKPMKSLSIAAVAKDLTEPELEDFTFNRQYSVGASLRLLEDQFRILGQVNFNDRTSKIENSTFKAGIIISSPNGFEILLGGINNPTSKNQFFAGLYIPLVAGIQFSATARFDADKEFLRYSGSIVIPLKSVSF